MPTVQYGNSTIEYQLTYQSSKKDVSIVVEWMKGVQVIAPEQTSEEAVHNKLSFHYSFNHYILCHDKLLIVSISKEGAPFLVYLELHHRRF